VSQYLHDVKDVPGFVVFHCGFPVAKGVKMDLEQPWILELLGKILSLLLEEPYLGSEVFAEYSVGGAFF